ncbi:MAG: hypothetical protein L0Y73_03875 [Candidatus Aminicenantes bacterium]|nr:hypothetical protein [Candidatus Aminicenantes bacterium]
MKQKNKIVITAAALLVLISLSCSGRKDHVVVSIPAKTIIAVDFSPAKEIFYRHLVFENEPGNYQPRQEVTDFFLTDLPRYIKRDIKPFAEGIDTSGSLLISGKMVFGIKERSVIRKVKDKTGKKEKSFVSIQHWTIRLEIAISEQPSGKEVFKKTYENNLSEVDPNESEYNFKALFNKMTDDFIKDLMKKERVEQRYLLLR